MKNEDQPAMPLGLDINPHTSYIGLTKLEYFSIKCMAAYRSLDSTHDVDSEKVAAWAVDDAKALLKVIG